MSDATNPLRWIILSLAVALLLTLIPMPDWVAELRAPWVALALLYWIIYAPERVGVFWGWSSGLLLDAGLGTVLGQHALSLSVMAWLAVSLYRRLRLYPPIQQALVIWLFLLAERLVALWVMGALGQPTPGLPYWISTLIGLLLWPWIHLLARGPLSGYARG